MRSQTLDVDGPVHYVSYDGPADGPTFVCVHGLGGSHLNWMSLAPLLAQRGRVLVPDLRGFGRTPLGDGTSASVGANRKLLERFIAAAAGESVIVVGNSMGGFVSLGLAAARPELVRGLVLVNPAISRGGGQAVDRTVAAYFAMYMVPKIGESFIDRRLRRMGPERVVQETLRMCAVDPSRIDPALVAASTALATERFERMPWATTAFLDAARSLLRALARRRRFSARVQTVAAPTLLIHGRHDRLVPLAAAERLARSRPDWDFVVFDHLGHIPMMEDPVATFGTIESWIDGSARLVLGGRAAVGETG